MNPNVSFSDSRVALARIRLGENQLEAYLARGGNLFILTDTGRQEVMNPFLSKFGIKMEEYQLAQSSVDFLLFL